MDSGFELSLQCSILGLCNMEKMVAHDLKPYYFLGKMFRSVQNVSDVQNMHMIEVSHINRLLGKI